jgi:hypothetical protein
MFLNKGGDGSPAALNPTDITPPSPKDQALQYAANLIPSNEYTFYITNTSTTS